MFICCSLEDNSFQHSKTKQKRKLIFVLLPDWYSPFKQRPPFDTWRKERWEFEFFFFNKMRFLYIYFIGYLSVANWIQYSSKIEISLRDTIYIYRDRLLRIYFPAGFWKCWPCCHDIVTSPIFLMRLHISQSLEPICGTTSTAWIGLNLHLSGECSNVSYEAVLWMFKQAFHTAGSRKILP